MAQVRICGGAELEKSWMDCEPTRADRKGTNW